MKEEKSYQEKYCELIKKNEDLEVALYSEEKIKSVKSYRTDQRKGYSQNCLLIIGEKHYFVQFTNEMISLLIDVTNAKTYSPILFNADEKVILVYTSRVYKFDIPKYLEISKILEDMGFVSIKKRIIDKTPTLYDVPPNFNPIYSKEKEVTISSFYHLLLGFINIPKKYKIYEEDISYCIENQRGEFLRRIMKSDLLGYCCNQNNIIWCPKDDYELVKKNYQSQ